MLKFKLVITLLFLSNFAISQAGLNLDISAIKTFSKSNALGLGVNYLKQYNSIDLQANGEKGFLNITPEIITQAGTNDAFSQLQLKLSGYFLKAKTTSVDGLITIDRTKTFHLFPLSIGLESNTDFSFVNTLFEAGYTPFYQGRKNASVSELFKHTSFGFFVQAGYKGLIDSTNSNLQMGGKKDDSKEKLNNGICRFKGIFTIDTKNIFTNKDKPGLGLIGNATYWYDFINAQIYYRIECKLRLYLTEKQFFDFKYEKGSGAPNFNQGEQFSSGLSVNF